MQGRLSKSISGKVQEFPSQTWENEFELANKVGVKAIEWTVDHKNYRSNPIFNKKLAPKIIEMSKQSQISIPSITLDCFVEAPIHAINEITGLKSNFEDLIWVVNNICLQDLNTLVLPIVAEAGDFDKVKLKNLIDTLTKTGEKIAGLGKRIAIECEFEIPLIAKLLDALDPEIFGINFDMGNSAAMGHSAKEEIAACGNRIFNVHIKDRILGGKTVPLGQGSVDFKEVAKSLQDIGYAGNMIMQAARDFNRPEAQVISEYISFCRELGWVND
jgi:L-ribulose-5-phosphate 3-epimerase